MVLDGDNIRHRPGNSFRDSQNMAFDKVKTLHAAEKSLEMGKIPAAIKEYCKIVEAEPDDFSRTVLLRLPDFCVHHVGTLEKIGLGGTRNQTSDRDAGVLRSS